MQDSQIFFWHITVFCLLLLRQLLPVIGLVGLENARPSKDSNQHSHCTNANKPFQHFHTQSLGVAKVTEFRSAKGLESKGTAGVHTPRCQSRIHNMN